MKPHPPRRLDLARARAACAGAWLVALLGAAACGGSSDRCAETQPKTTLFDYYCASASDALCLQEQRVPF